MKSIVVTNVFGTINRGDALLVEVLFQEIKESFPLHVRLFGIASRPDLEKLHLPDVEWGEQPGKSDNRFKVIRRTANIYYLFFSFVYTLIGAPSRFPPFLLPRLQQKSIRAIKSADLVVSCAGGFLVEETMPIIVSLFQLWAANHFKKTFILAPQTIGPIRSAWVRKLCANILNKSHHICLREDFSYNYVTQTMFIPARKVLRTSDMALYHQGQDADKGRKILEQLGLNNNEVVLGASVVDWHFPGADNPSQLRRDYESKLARLYKQLYDELGVRTLIVNQVSSDLGVAARIKNQAGECVLLDSEDRKTSEMRGMINACSIFLASRLHSGIFALLEHVPTTALAYNYKTNGIMADLNQSSRVWSIDSFDPQEVIEALKYDLAHRGERQKNIRYCLENLQFPRLRDVIQQL